MRFGAVPPRDAEGAVLAHSLKVGGARMRKGLVLGAGDIAALVASGIPEVWIARPGPGDVPEDEAAGRLASAIMGPGLRATRPATGRVNLHAEGPGLIGIDAAAIDAANGVDPAITIATLPPLARVAEGTMTATVKIITYAVDGAALERACAAGRGAMRLLPPVHRTAALLITEVPGAPEDPAGKGPRAVGSRAAALGAEMSTRVVAHEIAPLAEALRAAQEADVLLILTGSATSDPRDVAPAAVEAAGGRIERFGLPVDPGNLLFLGELRGRPVVGLPGCARSPALNGADWVMDRVFCGVPTASADLAAMGVGGLLKETPVRGRPRET